MIRDVNFLPIPDPGVKMAPDPGSETLLFSARRSAPYTRGWSVRGSALLSETSPAHTAICPGTGSSTGTRYLVFAHVLNSVEKCHKLLMFRIRDVLIFVLI